MDIFDEISDMMNQWDIENAKNLARKEGRAEGIAEGETRGRAEGILETARKMKSKDIPINTIAEITGLTAEQIMNF